MELMSNVNTFIGLAAAFFTTISYFPQLTKVWRTGETGDLSLKMLLALLTGLALWVGYGVLQGDVAIIAANALSVCFVGIIVGFKFRALMR